MGKHFDTAVLKHLVIKKPIPSVELRYLPLY